MFAPHPPTGTFSPQAGRRQQVAPGSPSPRWSNATARSCIRACAQRFSPRLRGEMSSRTVRSGTRGCAQHFSPRLRGEMSGRTVRGNVGRHKRSSPKRGVKARTRGKKTAFRPRGKGCHLIATGRVAPHPPAGTFSPQAGRRQQAALGSPSPRWSNATARSCIRACAQRLSPRKRGEMSGRTVRGNPTKTLPHKIRLEF